MAIINTRTGLKPAYKYKIKTGVLHHIYNGTRSGASNTFTAGSLTNHFGRCLNFVGNYAAARTLLYVGNTRFATT